MSKVLCVGAGHVGLPLALKIWDAGHDVGIVDIDMGKIDAVRAGIMPFVELGCAELLERAAANRRFAALTYQDAAFDEAASGAEFVILTLGTPLGTDYTFRFDQYFDVLQRIVPVLRSGTSVIVRSTVAPHFTRNVVTARIAREREWAPGLDFFPSFCPERLLQGNALADIDQLPEIIGADDPATAERVAGFFRSFGARAGCHIVTTVEAELAKLYLNTYRYALFGLANEFALIAEQYGADVYRILEAANTGYPRGGIPEPGPSRGPCLGKDTATLAFSSTAGLIAHAAIKTNENIVLHIAERLRSAFGTLAGRRIAVLGLAFKSNTDDTRDNLSSPLLNVLDREGALTTIYDPLVPGHTDPAALRGADGVVLMTAHAALRSLGARDIEKLCQRPRGEVYVLDLWNAWPWADHIFGRGTNEDDEDSGYRGVRLASTGSHSTPA